LLLSKRNIYFSEPEPTTIQGVIYKFALTNCYMVEQALLTQR